jgi:hypothetical protein
VQRLLLNWQERLEKARASAELDAAMENLPMAISPLPCPRMASTTVRGHGEGGGVALVAEQVDSPPDGVCMPVRRAQCRLPR